MTPDITEVHAYYRAALATLAFLERTRPTGRRFGADADARWATVAGGLTPGDRIDLLVRDADAEWPGSIGARSVFGFPDVAEDDAFGRRWPGLEGVIGETFFREAAALSPSDISATLRTMALAWGVTIADHAAPAVDPRARYVVTGPSAIVSLAAAFATTTDASWARQVAAFANHPAARQLAAAIPALLNQPGSALLLRSSEKRPAPFASAHAVISSDATGPEAAAAKGSAS